MVWVKAIGEGWWTMLEEEEAQGAFSSICLGLPGFERACGRAGHSSSLGMRGGTEKDKGCGEEDETEKGQWGLPCVSFGVSGECGGVGQEEGFC